MQRVELERRRKSAGFTLVELMTVVAIVGVLATIGIMLVRQHFRESKSLEAMTIIQSIRAAQEARRAETGSYLNVSVSGDWYPAMPDGKQRRSFVTTHDDAARWAALGVSRTDGTMFGFRTYAGVPGPVAGFVLATTDPVAFPDATDNWYVIEATGDVDADGIRSQFVASSFNDEVYVERDGE